MSKHPYPSRTYAHGIADSAKAILNDLVTDPAPESFLERQRLLGGELVRLIDRDRPVVDRHFRLIFGVPEIYGLAEGITVALDSFGASYCVTVHYHGYEVLHRDPFIDVAPLYHAFDSVDERPATVIVAHSCIGSFEAIKSSMLRSLLDRKANASEGLIVASPVMTADAKEDFAEVVGTRVLEGIPFVDWYALAVDSNREPYGFPIPGVGGDPWNLSSSEGHDGLRKMDAYLAPFIAAIRQKRKLSSGESAAVIADL